MIPHALADLPVLPLILTAQALDPLKLPTHAGSSLRGAFGDALYDLVCVHRERTACSGCPVEQECAYPLLFATRSRPGQTGVDGFEDLPRPYVIRAPAGGIDVKPGETLSWRVTLIGRAIEQLPYFALAWRSMGSRGIGSGRGRFDLIRVQSTHLDGVPAETVFDHETGRLHVPEGVASLPQLLERLPGGETKEIEVRFITPTQIKYRGVAAKEPEFHILWRSLQRRLSMLRLAHGSGRPEVSFEETIRLAAAVRLTRWVSRDVEWKRYSQRQKQSVPMRGFVGSARYAGDLEPFLPALSLGTQVGVGDNCTFGQGDFEISFKPAG